MKYHHLHRLGTSVSLPITTLNEHVATFPALSLTTQRTVVWPSPSIEPDDGLHVTVSDAGSSILSDTIGSGHDTVSVVTKISSGQVMVGGISSGCSELEKYDRLLRYFVHNRYFL